jgi:hypothetical protein
MSTILIGYSNPRPDSIEAQSRATRCDLLDQVLETLKRAVELARRLDHAEREAQEWT